MYSRLTKKTIIDGKECVSCVYNGTEMCQIHKDNDVDNCGKCPVFAAILNLLCAFEDVYEENR